MLLVTILAGIHGGPERGALVAFWAGLLYDSVTTAPLGLHALVFPSIAMAVSSLERRMLRNTLVTDALAVAAAVATGSAAVAAVGEIFGQASFDPGTLGRGSSSRRSLPPRSPHRSTGLWLGRLPRAYR